MRRIGRGGMGEVWIAWDPQLDRNIAIKLLRWRRGSERGGHELLREAKALARLAHPNIVAIHDVGSLEGQVFLAMEYVDGQTLAQWVKTTRRSWREIVLAYVQAAAASPARTKPG
ncbi:MAG: protein kinase [Myxococcales bacterium]|nr:protein kinase [Myxococcales bacterium]